jgi:hypothetical protein
LVLVMIIFTSSSSRAAECTSSIPEGEKQHWQPVYQVPLTQRSKMIVSAEWVEPSSRMAEWVASQEMCKVEISHGQTDSWWAVSWMKWSQLITFSSTTWLK